MSAAKAPWRTRLKFRPLSVFGMLIVWCILWGELSPFIVVSGILLAWLVDVVFPLPPIYWPGRFHPIGMVKLVGGLLWDLIVSSMRIVAYSFKPKLDLHPGLVRIGLVSDNDLYQVAVAEMISLVPGTVVVEVVRSPRRLYLHVFDLNEEHSVEDIHEMALIVEGRVLGAFGSDEEQAHFAAHRSDALAESDVDDEWEVDA